MKLKKFTEYINENSTELDAVLAQANIARDKEEAIDQFNSFIDLYKMGLAENRLALIHLEMVHTDLRLGLSEDAWERFLASIKQYGVVHNTTVAISPVIDQSSAKLAPSNRPHIHDYAEIFILPLSAFFVCQDELLSLTKGNEENFKGPKYFNRIDGVIWNWWLSSVI